MPSPNETRSWKPEPPTIAKDAPRSAASKRGAATVFDIQVEVDASRRPAARPGELLAGTRYRIHRWLGDGGMATVFEAVHEDLERSVALKVLRTQGKQRLLELFRQEAKTLAKLESKYAVDVYDFIELPDGRLVIAMELLRGATLREAMAGGPFPIARAISILRQVCKGLGAAHAAGVIHRDVKPENISLEEVEGRRDTVRLLDFGIAQIVGRTSGRQSRAGTPGYLAPEVVAGLGVDRRSDLYAVGCVAYEVLTGRRPFESDDAGQVLLAQISETPQPPSRHADVPAALERVVMRCLEKEPMARYASAEDLEAALCEAQIDLEVTTTWDDLPLPDVDPDRRERLLRHMPHPEDSLAAGRRGPRLVLAAVVVAAAVGIGWLGWSLREAPAPTGLAQPDRVGDLTVAARAAAARAYFVYPPPEDGATPTAFGSVRELERLSGAETDRGRAQALALRAEFADTLERLGDRYWGEEGGKAFAVDYYAEALVFDPERGRARERAAMTPGELRVLRSKAEVSEFSTGELEAAEPLIALADVADEQREARIDRIARRVSPRAEKRKRAVLALAKRRRTKSVDSASESPAVEDPSATPDDPAIAAAGLIPAALEEPSVDEPSSTEESNAPDRAKARSLTAEGRKAHAAGRSTQAEKFFGAALAADRRYAPAYGGLGKVAYDRGSYALAARMFKKAVRLAPRDAGLRIELGDAHYKAFSYQAAKAQYEQAKQLGVSGADGRLTKVRAKLE